jgi:hypothetical protein
VTAFFIPGCNPGPEAERAYAEIVAAAAVGADHAPRPVRIFRLAFRHGGVDLEAEVGLPDPVDGHTVVAILDLGRESPYLVQCGSAETGPQPLLVQKPVYSVTEFAT